MPRLQASGCDGAVGGRGASARRRPAGWSAATRSSDEAALGRRARPADRSIERRVNGLLRADDARREAAADPAALRRPGHRRRRRRQRRRRRLQPRRPGEDQRASSTSRSSSRGCTSRSCSPTTRSTATARSSRSRSARRAASTRRSARDDHRIGARESAAVGLKQIYSPMVDVSHEPRWGRIAEGGGEDPVPQLGDGGRARQGARRARDYSAPDKVVTSVKHFAAYGQPEGGRDYNTTDMSEQRLRNLYLPPFKAAIDAGADTVDVLVQRDQRRAGLREPATPRPTSSSASGASTASSRATTPPSPSCARARRRTPDEGPCGHGVAADGPDAAALALNAGTDSEMVSTNIRDFGRQLLAERPDLDAADQRRGAPDPADQVPRRPVRAPVRRRRRRPRPAQLRPDAAAARAQRRRPLDGAAEERRAATLPLDPAKKTAVIGPLGDRPARHARPVVGPRRATRTPSRVFDGHQGAEPGRDVRRRAAR